MRELGLKPFSAEKMDGFSIFKCEAEEYELFIDSPPPQMNTIEALKSNGGLRCARAPPSLYLETGKAELLGSWSQGRIG